MKTVLRLEKINKSFPGVKALTDMSFDVGEGEVHAICGENGAGKSTLMKIVSGVYQADSGRIFIDGEEVHIANPNDAFEKGIAIMHQETNLFAQMTILDNIFLCHELTKKAGPFTVIDYKAMEEKVKDILKDLQFDIDVHKQVQDIGMAQKQVVEIAKALTFNAKILIMDEPTASLTQKEVDALFAIIKRLSDRGVAIVYISHRLEEIFKICDRATVIRDGCWISTREAKDLTKNRLVADMVGREISSFYPKVETKIGETIFELKSFGQKGVFRNVNLTLRKGEIVGLSGLAGAGRTELAHAICGFTHPDSGQILFEGTTISIPSYDKAMEYGIVYVSEDRSKYGIITRMSVKENISLPQLKKMTKHGFVDFYAEEELGKEYIEKFDIKAPGTEFIVGNLSGGNQQKTSVAKAVAVRPKILILDEPTRGIDVNAKAEIHKLIGTLVSEGLAILMISSELPELLGMCDRIYVMKTGEVVRCFDREEATQEKILAVSLGAAATESTDSNQSTESSRSTGTGS